MAYRSKDLSALAYANGFTLWHYRTADSAAEVDNAGYFNGASRMLRVGDFIMLSAGADGAPSYGLAVVAANANGDVDVTNLTSFGAFNTD
jgi:hypothetical protein